jgi:hemolysin III
MALPMTESAQHYPDGAARRADLVVHIVGLAFALLGGAILVALAFGLGPWMRGASVLIYVAGMVAMLAASAAYNFAKAHWRPLMRRFDQAGIFIMIAGSYTPFTTQSLHGAWAWGMTAAVWALALTGVVATLTLPRLDRPFWIGLYLALGWVVVVAIKPIVDSLSWVAVALLALGGLVYSAGAILYGLKKFKFRRAIWHGHVVGASVLHYAAVLVGVVLVRAAG